MYFRLFCSNIHCVMKVLTLSPMQVTFRLSDVYMCVYTLNTGESPRCFIVFFVKSCTE